MAIPAQRFQFLDKETNVPSLKFTSSLDSSILNNPMNAEMPSVESLQNIIDSAIQSANSEAEKAAASFNVDDALSEVTRTVKGFAGSLMDLSSLPDKKLTEYLGGMFPDAGAARGIKSIIQNCRTNGSGYGVPGRPYDVSINCGAGNFSLGTGGYGSSNSCRAGSYSDLLNKLSGGAYNADVNDFNKLLKAFMALAGMGYNLDMCGIFSALSSGLPNDVLSKAAGGLLGTMGLASKTNAVLDIASAATGLQPLLHNPSGIETFLGNYKLPRNVTPSMQLQTAQRTTAGLELLDDSWNKSMYDDSLSLRNAPGHSDGLNSSMQCMITDKSYGSDDLDVVPDSDDDFTWSSYGMKDNSNSNAVIYL